MEIKDIDRGTGMQRFKMYFVTFTISVLFFIFLGNISYSKEHIPEKLRLSFLPHLSIVEVLKTRGPIITALEEELGIKIEVVGVPDYSTMIEMLKRKELDIAQLGPFLYVTAQDDFGLEILARLRRKDKKKPFDESYLSYIITRKDSGINSLEDLKGKSFAFTDPKSTSGYLFPVLGLYKAGVTQKDFSKVLFVKKNPNSLLAVYNGEVDAGALSNLRARGGVKLDEIKVLWQSDPIYRAAIVARKGFPKEFYIKLKSALLRLAGRSDAQKIFEKTRYNGFFDAKDSDYENVREAIKVREKLELGQ